MSGFGIPADFDFAQWARVLCSEAHFSVRSAGKPCEQPATPILGFLVNGPNIVRGGVRPSLRPCPGRLPHLSLPFSFPMQCGNFDRVGESFPPCTTFGRGFFGASFAMQPPNCLAANLEGHPTFTGGKIPPRRSLVLGAIDSLCAGLTFPPLTLPEAPAAIPVAGGMAVPGSVLHCLLSLPQCASFALWILLPRSTSSLLCFASDCHLTTYFGPCMPGRLVFSSLRPLPLHPWPPSALRLRAPACEVLSTASCRDVQVPCIHWPEAGCTFERLGSLCPPGTCSSRICLASRLLVIYGLPRFFRASSSGHTHFNI